VKTVNAVKIANVVKTAKNVIAIKIAHVAITVSAPKKISVVLLVVAVITNRCENGYTFKTESFGKFTPS
jgi:hypothetical protein